MRTVWLIARQEWRLLWRDRVAATALGLLVLLACAAALTAWDQRSAAAAERSRDQAQAHHEFDAQPDRHPHRMVHYGHFVFRTPAPLAAFDPGTEAFTGHTLFLEGHRQNSASFGDVRQNSLLLRFGQLTPALVLQMLAPLLLVFVGHACVARERQAGTLRVLLAQAVRPRQVIAGKLLALAGIAGLVLLPALVSLAALALAHPQQAAPAALLAAGYGCWLLLWAIGIVAASALFSSGRNALIALLAAWVLCVVLVPKIAADAAASSLPLTTRFEADIRVAQELAALGDSHNADDPYFAGFRKQVLERYGVTRIEALPVNYKGLLAMEGERLTTMLFERHLRANFERQKAQVERMDTFALLSPLVALQRLSRAASGTDLEAYRRFLVQADAHRYDLVQALNRLQAEALDYANDRSSRDNRIDRAHWQGLAQFDFEPVPPAQSMRRALPAGAVLVLWVALLAGGLALATRRLGRTR